MGGKKEIYQYIRFFHGAHQLCILSKIVVSYNYLTISVQAYVLSNCRIESNRIHPHPESECSTRQSDNQLYMYFPCGIGGAGPCNPTRTHTHTHSQTDGHCLHAAAAPLHVERLKQGNVHNVILIPFRL